MSIFHTSNVIDDMIRIPSGDILLRDDRKQNTWHVKIQPFLLHKYPVTQKIYTAITHHNPSAFIGLKNPVDSVSWLEATTFCNLLSSQEGLQVYYEKNTDNIVSCNVDADGYRLPTEAEWQYACQAGNVSARYGALDEIAWYKENAAGTTHAVGEKKPNDWGLYDMLGNVWEWCLDIYDEKVYGSYRIFRGGGWCDAERGCLATNRRRGHPTFQIDDLGFRIARSV